MTASTVAWAKKTLKRELIDTTAFSVAFFFAIHFAHWTTVVWVFLVLAFNTCVAFIAMHYEEHPDLPSLHPHVHTFVFLGVVVLVTANLLVSTIQLAQMQPDVWRVCGLIYFVCVSFIPGHRAIWQEYAASSV